MKQAQYKPIPIRPLTGLLDVRSEPDLMPPGSFRFRQNFKSPEAFRLCRREGWQKLLSKVPYNNQDLHDQLFPLMQFYDDLVPPANGADNVTVYPSGLCGSLKSRNAGRESLTLITELTSGTGFRKLIAANQQAIYELNERSGNWRILADGMGGPTDATFGVRFHVDQVKDTAVFTNDVDQPMAYVMGAPVQGCAMRALTKIPDLDTIFLTRAATVCAYKNVMFFGNVEMDGQRLQNRLVWSDYNDPTSWDPAVTDITGTIPSTLTGNTLSWSNPTGLSLLVQSRAVSTDPWKDVKIVTNESLIVADNTLTYRVVTFVSSSDTGFQDLPYGHKILGLIVLGDFLAVLTDRGVFQCQATGLSPNSADPAQQGAAFSFRCVYEQQEGDKCIAYPNTLTSTGGMLFWLARNGAYMYNFFKEEPERVDWIHKASGIIFNGIASQPAINEQCCGSPVAAYKATEKEIWVSWPVQGNCTPVATMVINVEEKFIDTVDAGFTAFGNFRSDTRGTLRDFLTDFCICNEEGLLDNGITFQKEGLPLPATAPSCNPTPNSIYTTQTRFIGGNPANGVMEDYNADPSPTSVCTAFGSRTIQDFCRDCNQSQLFVGADIVDKCLKQIGTSYARERCTNPSKTDTAIVYVDANGLITYQSNIGIYRLDGYYSIFRSQPLDFSIDTIKKQIKRILLAYGAVAQAYPCVVQLRIGVSYARQDPVSGMTTSPNNSQNLAEGCGPVWQVTMRKFLSCAQALSPKQYVARNLVPNQGMEFVTIRQAHYFYYEVVIANLVDQSNIAGQLAPATGGQSCFSQMETWVMPLTIDR